jgi:purine-binding chemotaxis protein CheW
MEETARSEAELMQLVSFCIDQEEYAVHVLKIMEIIRLPVVTRVPNAPHYVEGVINLRGNVIPLVSMRKRFSLDSAEHDKSTRTMIVEVAGELIGFIVDSVSEVIRIAESEMRPPPPVIAGGVEQECVSGVINKNGRLLIMLDPEKIFTRDERRLFGDAPCNTAIGRPTVA